MMARLPDRLGIDKADRELYDHDTVKNEILRGRRRKEQFLFAMAIGFKNRVKRPLDTREGWDDALVKQFRRNVRRQNICVRMRYPIYSSAAEHKRLGKEAPKKLRELSTVEEKKAFLEASGADWWIPERVSYPEGRAR